MGSSTRLRFGTRFRQPEYLRVLEAIEELASPTLIYLDMSTVKWAQANAMVPLISTVNGPVRSRCTTAAAGKTFAVTEHDEHLAANRARWRTDPDLADDYQQHRPMVERTIAWIIANSHRRVRYRGVDRNRLGLTTRAAIINLKRLLNLGLHHNGNTWNVTPAH